MPKQLLLTALTCASALAVASDRATVPTQPQFLRSKPHVRLAGRHHVTGVEVSFNSRAALAEAKRLQRLRASDGSALRTGVARANAVSVPGTNWVSLGPTDAISEFNGSDIAGVDSGRPNSILIDPRDANVVYMADSGGGVWKSLDFLSPSGPTWAPLSDDLHDLAVGSLVMDPANPDTLYLASGDAFDDGGNTVYKSLDGGITWSDPVTLHGFYPAPASAPAGSQGFEASVGDIRTLGVRGNLVLAGSNVGLFSSSDGGQTFNLVDLPNAGGLTLVEAIWTVVHVGNGHWLASGITSCDETGGVPPLQGSDPDPNNCLAGNNAQVWSSADGVAWKLVTTLPATTGTGRITLAAGAATDPTKTPVYAWVASPSGVDVPDGPPGTFGFWRSLDGGQTWADATGALANPTFNFAPGPDGADCADMDVGHGQAWYNQAILVDPSNPAHVLIGGNLCGVRTLNGTDASPKWELVSHWLPSGGGGTTANGTLPYVHADWHAAAIVNNPDGSSRVFAGTDGGLFSSTNVFDPATQAEKVVWTNHNRGLATHLMYSVASGDPANANPFVLFAGLQDNGTRFRSKPSTPSMFNQPIGGDGIGATVHVATGGATTYWGSVEFGRFFCQPTADIDCAAGVNWTRLPTTPDEGSGGGDDDHRPTRIINGDDAEPFFVRFSNVETDTTGQSVLTNTTGRVFVSVEQPDHSLKWVQISQDLSPPKGQSATLGFSNVTASRTIPGLYGAAGAFSRAPFYFTTTGNVLPTGAPTPWTVAKPVFAAGDGRRLTGASSIDFPPVTPTGMQPGQVFIGSFTGILNDGVTAPDDAHGRLWRTTDFGQTWTSIVGADPNHRLPNVPVYVVKYDPVTPTTIYAGTQVGAYLSTDDGATWDRLGQGLPMVPVRDLYVAKNQDFIRVATYGRGLWEIYPSASANHGAPGNGDFDRNLQLDWADLGALAARLGTTPATTTAPLYSWIEDLNGGDSSTPLQSIDDADLTALLAKLGDHP